MPSYYFDQGVDIRKTGIWKLCSEGLQILDICKVC